MIHKNNIADMITGLPTPEELDKFIQTGILLQEVKTNSNVIKAMIQ